MQALDKLKILVGLVSIAFAICNSLGIYHHQKVQKIKLKSHGYKAKSFCRTGIDLLRDILKGSVKEFEKITQKFLRYLTILKVNYHKNKLSALLSAT